MSTTIEPQIQVLRYMRHLELPGCMLSPGIYMRRLELPGILNREGINHEAPPRPDGVFPGNYGARLVIGRDLQGNILAGRQIVDPDGGGVLVPAGVDGPVVTFPLKPYTFGDTLIEFIEKDEKLAENAAKALRGSSRAMAWIEKKLLKLPAGDALYAFIAFEDAGRLHYRRTFVESALSDLFRDTIKECWLMVRELESETDAYGPFSLRWASQDYSVVTEVGVYSTPREAAEAIPDVAFNMLLGMHGDYRRKIQFLDGDFEIYDESEMYGRAV